MRISLSAGTMLCFFSHLYFVGNHNFPLYGYKIYSELGSVSGMVKEGCLCLCNWIILAEFHLQADDCRWGGT